LNRFDDEKQAFTHYLHDPSIPDSLSHNAVMRILEDRAGELWIATWGGGLNRLDRDTGRFVSYRNDPEAPQSLSHDAVFSLHEDEKGVLWVGTSHGLNRMVPRGPDKGPVFVRYTKDDGLPDSTIMGILEDENGNLWLSTNNGLSRFDPRTETFRNFDVTDGLQGNIFSQVDAYDRSGSGEMAFGGLNGFNAFYPDDIETNQSVPPVVLTDFQLARRSVPIGDDSVLQKSITETQALTLTYKDRLLAFEFAALDFRVPTKNQYRYRLDGLEGEWVEVGSDARSATYTNLAPGEYTFRVLGSNNHGVWNEQGASIQVTVLPLWWQTMWFRLLSVAAVVAALLTAHKARIGFIERRNVELEKEVKRRERAEKALLRNEAALQSLAGQLIGAQESERMRIAGELHDDLNQKLAALAIELDQLEEELPDADPLRERIVELEGRTAGLIEDVRRLSHRLHPATIEHVGLVAGLKSLCAEFGKDRSITVHVNLTELVESPSLDVALALYRIAQEAMQNAWKYSGAKEVRVSLAEMENGLQLVISDDGVGFDVDNVRRKGLGLVSMEERVRHLNGEFHLSSYAGKGTRVDARVPLIGKNLPPQ
jgi:signal transduction histidine kinase